MTNQIKNFIEEEKRIEEEFIEILEYGKDLTNEEVWTDLEKIQWLRKSMKSYKISLIKMIVEEYSQIPSYSCNTYSNEGDRILPLMVQKADLETISSKLKEVIIKE